MLTILLESANVKVVQGLYPSHHELQVRHQLVV